MESYTNGFLELSSPEAQAWTAQVDTFPGRESIGSELLPAARHDADFLRSCAWEVGERKAADSFTPGSNHVGLAMATPGEGFVHWRILPQWIDQTAWHRGNAWQHCRMVLRLYDVSCIHFDGLNAHHMYDTPLPSVCGEMFFKLHRPGTWQLAEVGFVLRNGEFIPAARSHVLQFPRTSPSTHGSQAALLVTDRGHREEIGNLWEQRKILEERLQPRLRKPLRIAAFSFAARATGQQGQLANFVTELAAGQCGQGHEVHVFVPASDHFTTYRQESGVHYHSLPVDAQASPFDRAIAYASAAESRLQEFQPFDLFHCHEWMTAMAPWSGTRPTILSLTSIEATRLSGASSSPLSLEIQQAERECARSADCILTPDWLRPKAIAELGLNGDRCRAFPMEGRVPNEWECPLDLGQVKGRIGVGPLDRLILFVGPLEHAAGVDVLLEAMPVLLQRCHNLRLAFVGEGHLHGQLSHRCHQLGVAHAVRLLGHVEGNALTPLLRAAEALVLPSRYRVPFDDAVVDLARRAGRPVVTTHGGPAHLVRHEETGILTYDNPGSMVWAMDRILGDPGHADRMGQNGRRGEGAALRWSEVIRLYMDICASYFPELTEPSL